ncbi:MAG: flagellin [Phycisphaerae bacterium]
MSRINTNVTSMIATRVLTAQTNSMNKALQRLSTGLRINSGADDPAGLIASETLRGQATALKAAIANGQRATNVISTAEGALNEVSSLLSQLNDAVSSAANTSGQSSDEIAAQQLQVDSILSTINRIANSTDFGGIKLLNGSLDYTTSGTAKTSAFDNVIVKSANLVAGAAKTITVQVTTSAQQAKLVGSTGVLNGTLTLQVAGKNGTQVFSFGTGTTETQIQNAVKAAKDLTGVSATLSGGRIKFISTEYGTDGFVTVTRIDDSTAAGADSNFNKGTVIGTGKGVDAKVTINGQTATANGLTASINTADLSIEITMNKTLGQKITSTANLAITGGGANFSLSPDVLTGKAGIGIQSITTGSIGLVTSRLSTLAEGQANNLSSTNLGTSQRTVKEAINQIASLRGRLGAFQKLTIDSTSNSMNVALENTTAAESAIRDADFAAETANMTRSQILVQAATVVLRQANQAPQNVLSLLQ